VTLLLAKIFPVAVSFTFAYTKPEPLHRNPAVLPQRGSCTHRRPSLGVSQGPLGEKKVRYWSQFAKSLAKSQQTLPQLISEYPHEGPCVAREMRLQSAHASLSPRHLRKVGGLCLSRQAGCVVQICQLRCVVVHREVDIRLHGKGKSDSHGAKPVYYDHLDDKVDSDH
jgi:hypothetical protein